jgi:hypothetical protein
VASRAKVWRIEAGRSSVKVGDVLALSRFYEVDAAMTDELIRLAEASKGTGYLYLEEYGTEMPQSLGFYAELEGAASAITDYQSEMVHGLLQTAEYARAVIEGNPAFSAQAIDRRVAFRLQRQRAFFDRPEPARMDALVTAGALSVQVGSTGVMQEQREHLRALARRDGVSIRVLPFENGLHPGMRGPFTVLDFDDPEDPALVYIENVVESRYIEEPAHVARFRKVFGQMWAQTVPVEEYLE